MKLRDLTILTLCMLPVFAESCLAQSPKVEPRTSRGQPMSPGMKKPSLGDPVFKPTQPDPPPFPVKDLNGNDVPNWQDASYSCTAHNGQVCEEHVRIPIEKGWEYCSHVVRINSWNHALYQVEEVAPDHVTVLFAAHSGSFPDAYGANIDAQIVVGIVRAGRYDQSCLPHRSWSAYAHGTGPGYLNDRCATMPAYEVPFDKNCARDEQYPVSGKAGPMLETPCITCGREPDSFPAPPPPSKP